MPSLQLFFMVIGVGFIGLEMIAGGLLILFFTTVLYMCDVAISYWKEGDVMTRPKSQRPKMAYKIHQKKTPVEQQNEASRKAYEQEMNMKEAYLKQLNKENGIGGD